MAKNSEFQVKEHHFLEIMTLHWINLISNKNEQVKILLLDLHSKFQILTSTIYETIFHN